ncbi:dCTP pyrophosphatase 1 [Lampetra fluviatilis]
MEAEANGEGSFSFSPEPTLETLRQMQEAFTEERDWRKFHQPRSLLLALVGEVGELAELFQWRCVPQEPCVGLPGWSEGERAQLGQELADVLIYLLELSAACHVDLPRAALHKLGLNRLKYPAGRVRGSARKHTEYAAGELGGGGGVVGERKVEVVGKRNKVVDEHEEVEEEVVGKRKKVEHE